MLRSRVTSGIDVGRLSNAVSRPGIDPRVWVTYGVLTSEPYIETVDGEQDIIVDVMLLPTMQDETARVGAMYAGNGYGFYCPLHEGDEVLVVAPSGDPDEGLVISQRLFSPAAVPPTEVVTNPEDVTLVVQEGKSLRLSVKGAGNVVIAADQGQVKLGDESATQAVARVDDQIQFTLTPADILTMVMVSDPATGAVTATNSVTVTGTIKTGASKVVAS